MCTAVSFESHDLLDRFRPCCLVLVAWIGASISQISPLAAGEVMASTESRFATSMPVSFDIPAQPLVSALNTYSSVMHMGLFYDGALVTGRQSSPVQGALSPPDALRRLLNGTGLVARVTDVETITISRPDASPAQELAAVKSRSTGYWPYLSRIQVSVREAFCRHGATQSETGDVLLRFWIGPTGAVARAELSTPGGAGVLNAAYAEVISKLDVGQSPPPNMPQPVTMMIMARSGVAGCASSSSRQATAR
jgi:hypothetical protein